MSAIVCGKRSFFEDIPSPPVSSKRIRCSSSTSPIRFSPPRPSAATSPIPNNNFSSLSSLSDQISSASVAASTHNLNHLRAIFPDMDDQLLERALEDCGNDLDYAIKGLNELCLGSTDRVLGAGIHKSAPNIDAQIPLQVIDDGEVASSEDALGLNNLQMDGSEWVELFVREMTTASNMEDARARASRVLEVLEKNIHARAGVEAAQSFHKENMMLKEQMEILIRENTILKRAVAIQHERQKEYEDRTQELQHLKQLVSQYQEQLRTLEVNNYALTMHLRQTQQSTSIPGRFHPDVF
ncbi:uncharacterized protein LOC122067464 isoform X2 [Macadamia integrifolia]|uniref:uncharacterized protein LOC122067464 isoform X2 n=1 Tax=Macadamia integrifolia TaxID=60698 RepID=UPI001C4F9935|nr:uncharacterized protein LOC122067464 isoform X2 [Macadamia integrifolia]